MNRWTIWAALFLGMALSGCSAKNTASSGSEDTTFSKVMVASVLYSDRHLRKGGNFSWTPKGIHFYDDPRFGKKSLQLLLQDAILQNLARRGYRFESSANSSDFSVGYVLALESALGDDEMNAQYKINPGLPGNETQPGKYEKGTFIIDIIDSRGNRLLWRGAIQGFANFEMEEEQRKKRIKKVVNLLLQNYFDNFN